MTSPKDSMPYILDQAGSSVLETTTILNSIIRPHGYNRDIIQDIAVNLFLDNERKNLQDATNIHLLALKKILLYAIPVIGSPKYGTSGILLTSQVACTGIQYDIERKQAIQVKLIPGDRCRVIGFAFPNNLVSHLSYSIFPWKYFNTKPLTYQSSPLDISHMEEVDATATRYGKIYLIKSGHYEDVGLFNDINRYISLKLNEDMNVVLMSVRTNEITPAPWTIGRIQPFGTLPFLKQLNATLRQEIDPTYSISFYESLNSVGSWRLYDQIRLLGFSSPEVTQLMVTMAYNKDQKDKALTNIRQRAYNRLLDTRAEKITREKCPYYFDYTDRRAIFVRFNRFSLDKVPKKDRHVIQILLEKDLAEQSAILHNKCEHIAHLRKYKDNTHESGAFENVEPYINYDALDKDQMYPCKLCSYPLMCIHEVDFQEAMQSIHSSNDSRDQEYWVRQKIINQYKLIGQIRSGSEDTEALFTFYCKYCGQELGKSENIIQAPIAMQDHGSSVYESDPDDQLIYLAVSSAISMYMNGTIVPADRVSVTKLISFQIRPYVKQLVSKSAPSEQENRDIVLKYLSWVYTFSSLISINLHKIKSKESILISAKLTESRESTPVSGGAHLKDELLMAFKIIQSHSIFKKIGITDTRIKALLIDAFKTMNKSFSDDDIQLKLSTKRDRMKLDIKSSPITYYAQHMYHREHGTYHSDPIALMGVDMNLLYAKGKDSPEISTHALYSNMYTPVDKKSKSDDAARHIIESYLSIVNTVTLESANGRYISQINPPPNEFILGYESEATRRLRIKRTNPRRHIPSENGREYEFDLAAYDTAYCHTDGDIIRPHRWTITKNGNKLAYTCQHCGMDIAHSSIKNNTLIADKLHDKMIMEAFFELYTLVCPIKDAHVFVEGKCAQCDATTEQLESMSPVYYKKYSTLFKQTRKIVTERILDDTASILQYASPIGDIPNRPAVTNVDVVKLETITTSISKLYNQLDLRSVGMRGGVRSLPTIESYVRTFYSYYTFAKNASRMQRGHYDSKFYSLVQKNIVDTNKNAATRIPPLPEYPSSTSADGLLLELLQIIFDLMKESGAANEIVRYIVSKIVEHDSRHGDYNFAKLKSIPQSHRDLSDDEHIQSVDEDVDDEIDMFDGYDISAEDLEDNVDGDLD